MFQYVFLGQINPNDFNLTLYNLFHVEVIHNVSEHDINHPFKTEINGRFRSNIVSILGQKELIRAHRTGQ